MRLNVKHKQGKGIHFQGSREPKDVLSLLILILGNNNLLYIYSILSVEVLELDLLVGGKVGAHTRDTKTDRETS